MLEIVNTWQFNVVAYLVCVVVYFQTYKLAVQKAKYDGAATILLQIIAGVSILLFIPFYDLAFTPDGRVYFLLFLACIFYAINDRLQTTSRKHLQVSVFSIVGQLTNVFLIVYGLTLFKESLMGTKMLGAAIILLSNVILFYNQGKLVLNKFVVFGILASFAFATAISIDINVSKHFNLPFYISITLLIPALIILCTERLSVKEIYEEAKSKALKYYLITGFVWGLSILFSLRSFQLGEVSTVVPLQASAVLLNVLVASIIFKEHEYLGKKILAAFLVFVGIYLTVLH